MPSRRQRDRDRYRWPRCLYLAGVDGSGKTTQARALLAMLRDDGVPARYVWLRFPRLLSIPFLIYARLRGFSVREHVDGYEHGYWDFRDSWLMTTIFPWVLWIDTCVLVFVKLYLPLIFGYTVVCDRCVIDILVDLVMGVHDERLDERLPGRLFLRVLPHDTRTVVLDLDTRVARERSPELRGDRSHARRRAGYLKIAEQHHVPVVSTEPAAGAVTKRLVEVLTDTVYGTSAVTAG